MSSSGQAIGTQARLAQPVPMLVYVSSRLLYPDDDIAHSLTFYSRRPVRAVIGLDSLRSALACSATEDAVLDHRDLAGLGAGFEWRERWSWFRFGLGTLTRRC